MQISLIVKQHSGFVRHFACRCSLRAWPSIENRLSQAHP